MAKSKSHKKQHGKKCYICGASIPQHMQTCKECAFDKQMLPKAN
jgi:predicted nucleic acid-binding Zn ribbon protein